LAMFGCEGTDSSAASGNESMFAGRYNQNDQRDSGKACARTGSANGRWKSRGRPPTTSGPMSGSAYGSNCVARYCCAAVEPGLCQRGRETLQPESEIPAKANTTV
jgi:hypothetical protein